MKTTRKWVTQFLETLALKGENIRCIFDEIVYGKEFTCLHEKKKGKATLYLNEDVPSMLVGVINLQTQVYFNLRETQLLVKSIKHEADFKLLEDSYIVLQQEKQQIILLFDGQSGEQRRMNRQSMENFLQFLKFYLSELNKSQFEMESLLLHTFATVDVNQNMTLSATEMKDLLCKLRMKENDEFKAIVSFVRREKDSRAEVTFSEFEKIMKLNQCRIQFKELFEKLAQKKIKSIKYYMEKVLPFQRFVKFLEVEQIQGQNANKIAKRYFSKEDPISFYDFSRFMVSQQTKIQDENLESWDEKLNQPLTKYHCLSSHNTYLTGNQFTSDSRASRYRDDLTNGYRCLQIDVHNGDFEPIVKHGFTITSSITFREVIQSIARFTNEHPSHSPIILSLDNHADQEQQRQIADILRSYFGEKILTISPNINLKNYPTLQSAIGKIIIKNPGTFLQYKMSIADNTLDNFPNEGQEKFEEKIQTPSLINEHFEEYPSDIQEHLQQFYDLQRVLQKEKSEFAKSQAILKKEMQKQNINLLSKGLKRIIHRQLLKLTSMLANGNLRLSSIWQSVSKNENAILDFYQTDPNAIKEWTDNYWMRAYPSGSRMDSSNFNPIPSLEMGVQIIALNSQTADHYALVLRTFFRREKKKVEGYRLKNFAQTTPLEINIYPISCFMISSLNDPSIIPSIEVKMSFLGCAKDMDKNEMHTNMATYTQCIKDNAYNPFFSDTKIMQLKVTKPQFAFILIQIQNCGKAVISIEGLKRGYRSVALFDNYMQETKSKVIFRIQ